MANNYFYGLDFGGRKITLTASDGKINKLIENPYSEKSTQVCVVFADPKFLYGRAATTQKCRYFDNFSSELKEYFGKMLEKEDVLEKEKWKYSPNTVKIKDGILYFHIKSKYSIEEYLSINLLYLLNLNEIKESMIKEGNEVIISFPSYYDKASILYLKEIYEMIDLKVIDIIPEYMSISLCYGYENNSKMKAGEIHRILIIDIGYINMNITLSEYKKDECKILNHLNSQDINGRLIDELLLKSICRKLKIKEEECKNKTYIKILDEIIKMKEKLSADGADSIQLTIDCGLEDYECDYSVNELNELLKQNGMKEKIIELLSKSIKESCVKEKEKSEIEILIIGGSSRIPYIQSILIDYLKNGLKSKYLVLNKTINMDECISYGNLYNGLMKKGYWKYKITDNTKFKCFEEVKVQSGLIREKENIKTIFTRIVKDSNLILNCSKLRNEIESNIYDIQREIESYPNSKSKDQFIQYLGELMYEIRSKDFILKNDLEEIRSKEKELENHKKLYLETTKSNKTYNNNNKIEEMKEKIHSYLNQYYSVYPGTDTANTLLNEIDKIEKEKQEKKLSDRLEKMEKFIKDYEERKKEKMSKVNELVELIISNEFDDDCDPILTKSNKYTDPDRVLQLIEYDNFISELIVFLNNNPNVVSKKNNKVVQEDENYPDEDVEEEAIENEKRLQELVSKYPFYQGVDRINIMLKDIKDQEERKSKICKEILKFERFLKNYNPAREEKINVINGLVEYIGKDKISESSKEMIDKDKYFSLEGYERLIGDLKLIKQQIETNVKPISPKSEIIIDDNSELIKEIEALVSKLKFLIDQFPFYSDIFILNNILTKSQREDLKERKEELEKEKEKFDGFIKEYQIERKERINEISELIVKIKEEECNDEEKRIITTGKEYVNDNKKHSIGCYEGNIKRLKGIIETQEKPKTLPKLKLKPHPFIESKEQNYTVFVKEEKKDNKRDEITERTDDRKYVLERIKVLKDMLNKVGGLPFLGDEGNMIIAEAKRITFDKNFHRLEEYENCIKQLNRLMPQSEPANQRKLITKTPQFTNTRKDDKRSNETQSNNLVLRNIPDYRKINFLKSIIPINKHYIEKMFGENRRLYYEINKTQNYYEFSSKVSNLNNKTYERLNNIWIQSVTIIKKIINAERSSTSYGSGFYVKYDIKYTLEYLHLVTDNTPNRMKEIGSNGILFKKSGNLISSDIDFDSLKKEQINRICLCAFDAVIKLISHLQQQLSKK